MGFDLAKFESMQFKHREKEIPVPELKDFFDEKGQVWTVRGLTGEELARVNEAVTNNTDISSVISAVAAQVPEGKVNAIKEMMGISDDSVPNDIVRRIAMIVIATTSFEFAQDMAVKFCRVFPTTFYKITNEITRLTGLGQVGE